MDKPKVDYVDLNMLDFENAMNDLGIKTSYYEISVLQNCLFKSSTKKTVIPNKNLNEDGKKNDTIKYVYIDEYNEKVFSDINTLKKLHHMIINDK